MCCYPCLPSFTHVDICLPWYNTSNLVFYPFGLKLLLFLHSTRSMGLHKIFIGLIFSRIHFYSNMRKFNK